MLTQVERYFFIQSILPYSSRKAIFTLPIGARVAACAAKQITLQEVFPSIEKGVGAVLQNGRHAELILEGPFAERLL
jgi:hypothetical protein